jgi:hypothetical protein
MVLEIHYRWQITKWEQLEMLKYPVFPTIVVNEEVLETNADISEFLHQHGVSYEQLIEMVPDGFCGTTDILHERP